MQSSMDPRNGFYQAAQAEVEETTTPVRKAWTASPNQRQWIVNLINDRFLPAEAERRIAQMNWDDPDAPHYVDRTFFDKALKFLKGVPTLKKQGLEAPVLVDQLPYPEGLMHGTYTITFTDGTYKVIKILKQGAEESFKPGAVLLSFQSGPDNEHDYRGFGEVTEEGLVKVWFKHRSNVDMNRALHVLMSRPQEGDEQAVVTRSSRCAACTHTLTAPSSKNPYRDLGYGPDCGKRLFG